jgi:hypothetical protein
VALLPSPGDISARTRGSGSTEYSGKIRTRARRFRARFNDVEDRSGTATVARPDYVEIDSGDLLIFKHEPAQFTGIHDQHHAIDPCLATEADFADRMVREGE